MRTLKEFVAKVLKIDIGVTPGKGELPTEFLVTQEEFDEYYELIKPDRYELIKPERVCYKGVPLKVLLLK